ncbi:porin [Pannonibacter sp.]|uniref:porin n=1 Tax=Pannonibacter sp. TaxID=1906786 RepID=UPI003F6F4E48
MNLKSIMLGAAAAAAAVTGAQAADLPVAPEPVDYVRVCDAFGARFFYIPGTETCLRVGGRVRVDFYFNDFGDEPNKWNRAGNGTSTRARGYLYLDARTNTEYGLVRAYTTMLMTRDSGGSTGYDLDKAFIQFGNFTFGRAGSQYDFYTGNAYNQIGKNWSDSNSWVAAYTAAFGNGVSATISLEDGTYRRTGTGFAGHRYPDLVAALKVDQGWGSAKVMAALHEARLLNASSDAKLGFGIGAGVTIKLPMLGSKDTISFQAQYADGALSYAGITSGAQDVVFSGGSTRTSKAWSVSGGLYHAWTDTLASGLDASYADVDAPFGGTDFDRWSVSGNLMWTPVSGLEFGAELGYSSTDFSRGVKDKDALEAMFRVQRTF